MNNKTLLELNRRIQRIHFDCNTLCKNAFAKYFRNAGNIGIFCQSDDEYRTFTELKETLTMPSSNPRLKYFTLIKPIIIPEKGDVPQAIYTHLYIRKPDSTPYGLHIGDVDFILPDEDYFMLKKQLIDGLSIRGARIYPFNTQDMIELSDPNIDSLAYISTEQMTIVTRAHTNML